MCSKFTILLILVLRIILQEIYFYPTFQDFYAKIQYIIFNASYPSHNSTQNTSKMTLSTLETGPKLNWTRDNQMYEHYSIWRKKVEFIFCSPLADATTSILPEVLDG